MGSSDCELLREFINSESQQAFAEIVLRHGGMVRAAAIRQVRRHDLADDVTQAVFIVLARRAGAVPGEYLPAWLLRTTRFCARDALKMLARRDHHEKQAAKMRSTSTETDSWRLEPIAEFLDPAIARLRTKEQNAIALRFLQGKSTAEVAQAMGITTDAAQKIIARSLVKLRRILASRGVTLSTGAALAESMKQMVAGGSSQAMANAVSAAATGGGASATPLAIAQGASQLMVRVKSVWTASVVAIAALVVSATLGLAYLVHSAGASKVAVGTFVQPFASPFLELVGCRIKERLALDLSSSGPQPSVTLNENQYFQIEWTGNPRVATPASGYDLVVRSADATNANSPRELWRVSGIPAEIRTVVYGDPPTTLLAGGSSTQAAPLSPGKYVVEFSAHPSPENAAPPTKLATLPFQVEPYLVQVHIGINDVREDGSIFSIGVIQDRNRSSEIMTDLNFTNNGTAVAESLNDADGLPLQLTQFEEGDHIRNNYHLNRPVRPGEPLMVGVTTTLRHEIGEGPDQTLTYKLDPAPDANEPSRRIDLIRLPPGARVVSTDPASVPQQLIDGQVQLFVDQVLPPGTHRPTIVRYKLATANWR